jgi:hypothetical protein
VDLNKFEWPWPTTLTDTEVEQVIVRLYVAADHARAGIVDAPSNFIAAFAAAAPLFFTDYLDNRQAGIAGFQQIDPTRLGQ